MGMRTLALSRAHADSGVLCVTAGRVRPVCLQNVTGDLNTTVVNFKTSALSEMKPAWEDVQRAADSFTNSTVNVAAQGTNGIVYFGNETWTSLQAAGSPALAPVTAPKVISLSYRTRTSALARSSHGRADLHVSR